MKSRTIMIASTIIALALTLMITPIASAQMPGGGMMNDEKEMKGMGQGQMQMMREMDEMMEMMHKMMGQMQGMEKDKKSKEETGERMKRMEQMRKQHQSMMKEQGMMQKGKPE
jgi:hypothetical protein